MSWDYICFDMDGTLSDSGPGITRCADYALRDRADVVNLFVTAPLENRVRRVAARNGISEDEAKERIRRRDRDRAAYYNFYSAKEWGEAKSYDLCIDSSLLGIEGTAQLIVEYVKRRLAE